MAKFWKSLSILKNHFKISGKYFEKSLLPDCPDWKENSTMIKKSYVPFYQSVIFLFLLAVVASVSKNTCISIFFNKFESNIEKFEANDFFNITFESNIEKIVGLEFFNITFEFIEKNRNASVFWHGSNNSEEKQKNYTLVERDITFLYHCWVFLSIRTIR